MAVSNRHARNYVFIAMGVSGVGKSTIASSPAERIYAQFIEAADHNSSEYRTAMEQGKPLDDKMRLPWLLSRRRAAETARDGGHVVMACSALKRGIGIFFGPIPAAIFTSRAHAARKFKLRIGLGADT